MDFLKIVLLNEHVPIESKRNISRCNKTLMMEMWQNCISSFHQLSYSNKFYRSYNDILGDFDKYKFRECDVMYPFYLIDKTDIEYRLPKSFTFDLTKTIYEKNVKTLLIQTTDITNLKGIAMRVKNIIINIFSNEDKNNIIENVRMFLNNRFINLVFVQVNINGETMSFDTSEIKEQYKILQDIIEKDGAEYCTINKKIFNNTLKNRFLNEIKEVGACCQNFAMSGFKVGNENYVTRVFRVSSDSKLYSPYAEYNIKLRRRFY